eukprot:s1893_g5.t1
MQELLQPRVQEQALHAERPNQGREKADAPDSETAQGNKASSEHFPDAESYENRFCPKGHSPTLPPHSNQVIKSTLLKTARANWDESPLPSLSRSITAACCTCHFEPVRQKLSVLSSGSVQLRLGSRIHTSILRRRRTISVAVPRPCLLRTVDK